jgi:hypothetical protein
VVACLVFWRTCWEHSASILSGYRLDDRAIEVRSPAEAKGFFLYPLCPDWLRGPPNLWTVGTGGLFPWAKAWLGRDADHSPILVPKSRMSRSYTSPPRALIACGGTALAFSWELWISPYVAGDVSLSLDRTSCSQWSSHIFSSHIFVSELIALQATRSRKIIFLHFAEYSLYQKCLNSK